MAVWPCRIFRHLLDSGDEKSFKSIHRGFLLSHTNLTDRHCAVAGGELGMMMMWIVWELSDYEYYGSIFRFMLLRLCSIER